MEFTDDLNETDVEFLSKFCNPRYVQQALAKEGKLIYIYHSPRTNSWTKFSMFVLSRAEKNVPISVALCFFQC